MPDQDPSPNVEVARYVTSPADRFAAIMWGWFLEGYSIDGFDLQTAIERSGLGEHRPATEQDLKGTALEGEIEVGDPLTFLTPAGKMCVNRGAAANREAGDA